jgi:HK97 family phage portal protein
VALFDIFKKTKAPAQVPTTAASPMSVTYGSVNLSDIINAGTVTTVSHPDQAVKIAEYYNCVNKISNTVSTLSRNFYQRTDTSNVKLTAQDYYQVFLWKKMIAPGIIPSKAIKAWVANYLKGGNGYMIVKRDMRMQPITYINRKWYEMVPFMHEGSPWYYDAIDRSVYPWYNVLHLADITDDSLIGKTKTSHQAETLGRSKAANDFVNKYFAKGLTLGAVIEYPPGSGIDDDTARQLEATMTTVYGGVDKAGQVGVITEGGSLKQIKTDIPLGDANYIQGQEMTKKDIKGMFGIPETITDENTLSQYYNDAIMPIVRMIEEEINLKVVSPDQIGIIYMKIEMDSLLRADVSTRANVLEKYLRNSIYTINEVRAILDKAPIEGGDQPLVMANNLVPLEQLQEYVDSKTYRSANEQVGQLPADLDDTEEILTKLLHGKIEKKYAVQLIMMTENISEMDAKKLISETGL